jgi:hypothetical protein
MPFPFIPGGIVLALSVLGGAIALFGIALKALDWSIDSVKGSMLSGVVSGLRDWENGSRRPSRRVSSSATGSPGGTAFESSVREVADLVGTGSVTLERVRPHETPHHPG